MRRDVFPATGRARRAGGRHGARVAWQAPGPPSSAGTAAHAASAAAHAAFAARSRGTAALSPRSAARLAARSSTSRDPPSLAGPGLASAASVAAALAVDPSHAAPIRAQSKAQACARRLLDVGMVTDAAERFGGRLLANCADSAVRVAYLPADASSWSLHPHVLSWSPARREVNLFLGAQDGVPSDAPARSIALRRTTRWV